MRHLDRSLRELIGYRLQRTNSTVQSKFSELFATFGLRRTTFSALTLIANTPGLRQSQLAEALDIERPNLVQIVDGLEAAGLVERETAKDDRRAYALQPTAAGRRLYEKAMAVTRERDAELMHGLTRDQADALCAALRIIQKNADALDVTHELEISRT